MGIKCGHGSARIEDLQREIAALVIFGCSSTKILIHPDRLQLIQLHWRTIIRYYQWKMLRLEHVLTMRIAYNGETTIQVVCLVWRAQYSSKAPSVIR